MRRRLQNVVVAAFTERLPQKAAALFFALVLWVIVRSEEPVERVVPVHVSFLLETDSGDAVPERVPAVSARVVGRARDLVKLASVPPEVRRSVEVRARDTVRLELRPSDVELPTGVQAVVREVRPHWVTVVPVLPGRRALATATPAAAPAAPTTVPQPREPDSALARASESAAAAAARDSVGRDSARADSLTTGDSARRRDSAARPRPRP